MGFIINFVLYCAISAAILSAIPLVKSKSFGASMAVAALMSIFASIISVLTIPAKIVGYLVVFIPFLNIILLPLVSLCFAWLTSTLALYIADQMIEDFEIKSFSDTALTALALGIGQTVVAVILTIIF